MKKSNERDIMCPSIRVRTAGLWGIGLTVLAFLVSMIADKRIDKDFIYIVFGMLCTSCGVVILFTKTSDEWKEALGLMIFVFGVVISVILLTPFRPQYDIMGSKVLTCMIFIFLAICCLFLLCMMRCRNIRIIAEQTRRIWLIEDLVSDTADIRSKANTIIMRRVANWTDFIHCGQCCAMAWILGSACVLLYCLRHSPFDNGHTISYTRINLGLLCSLLLLSLELIADWHRYHHVLYVLNSKACNSSSNADDKSTASLPSSSNSTN